MSEPKKISFTDRVRQSIASLIGGKTVKLAYQGAFESARQSVHRTRIEAPPPQDFRRELNDTTRKELVRLSRYLEKNNGLYRQMIKDNALYSVGDGIGLQALGGDYEWQTIVEAEWEAECEKPEVSGRFSMTEALHIISNALDVDGEIFAIKTKRSRIPKFQLIESHRVSTPPSLEGQSNIYDGIRYNKYGQPTIYYVVQGDGSYTPVPASSMMHIYEAEKASQSRAYPPHQHAISNLRDEMDLLSMEKVAAKDNARTSRILKVDDTSVDDQDVGLGQSSTSGQTTDPNTLNRVLGGVTAVLATNENLTPYQSARPTSAFTGFIEHLRRDSVMGSVPYEFVADPTKAGGASVRLITAKAGRFFGHRQNIIINRFLKIYFQFWLGTKIDRGDLPSAKNWWKSEWVCCKSVSVDAGRDAANERADLEMGRILPSDDFQSRGMGFEKSMRKKARDLAFIDKVAKETGVDPNRLWKQGINQPATPAGQPPAPAKDANGIPLEQPPLPPTPPDPLSNDEPEVGNPDVSDEGVEPSTETELSVDSIPKQNQGLSRQDKPV
jgi:capsid protein